MIINIILALILFVLASWLVFRGANFLFRLVCPSTEIVLVPFQGTDEEKKLSGDLSAKLRQLQNSRASSPAYGYFGLPSIALPSIQVTPPLSATQDVLEKLDLKIHDVSTGAIVKAFNALLAPERYELQGTVTSTSDQLIIRSELVRGDTIIRSWRVGGTKEALKERSPTEKPPTLDDLLDDLLYQIVFDLAEDPPPGFKGPQTGEQTYHFENWQSLRDFVHGLRSLRAYQHNINRKDLIDVVASFSDFAIQAPSDPFALYFHGLALAGDRQDEQAIAVFRQLQRVLERRPDQDKWKEMLREAKLNEAIVTSKLYTRASADDAVSLLEGLIKELTGEKELSEAINGETNLVNNLKADGEKAKLARARLLRANTIGRAAPKFKEDVKAANERVQADVAALKLLVLAYAHLAQSHGTILAFLRTRDDADFQDQAKAIHENLESADRAALTTWEAEQEVSASEREKSDIADRVLEMRIENARGYCTYRDAVLLPKKEAEAFRANCNTAIRCLEKANAAYPNYYAVLQNLGTIYADQRFDPEGRFLELAEDLLQQTDKFVPNDYYQCEVLAVIHRRRAEMQRLPDGIKKEVDEGRQEAKKAYERRPQSYTALIELARLNRIFWQANGKKEEDATTALDSFRNASTEFDGQQDFLEEYLSFVKDLADAKYPSDKLGQQLVRLANNSGLSQETQAKLTALKLHLTKVFWETNGKKNDEEAKSVLKLFREAMTKLQNQGYFDDYLSLIKELAQAREKDAAGLSDLLEHLEYLEHSLTLPENKEVQNKAEQLRKELERLPKIILGPTQSQ